MAIDSAPSMQLAYKAHTTGVITAGSEPTASSNPGASGAQSLRRTRSTLALERSSFQSQEFRADRQISDYRLGGRRVTGSISGELSPSTYGDFFQAASRGTWAVGISKSQTEFTSMPATASSSKFTVGGSTWAAEGFRVGDVIRFTGLSTTGYNNKNYLITALSGVDATVKPAPSADMSTDTSFTVATAGGKKLVLPTSGHLQRLFAFEHYYSVGDLSHYFSECRIGGFRINMPAEGIVTAEFPVIGRNMVESSGGSAPFFSSPTAPTTSSLLTTIGGRLTLGGTEMGVITAASLNYDIGLATQAVAFNALVPEIFENTQSVSGQITALLDSNTWITSYLNETEVEIALMMTTSSADNANFISIFLPRVKFTGARVGDGALDGVPVTLPFQALIKASATGYDNTSMTIWDNTIS